LSALSGGWRKRTDFRLAIKSMNPERDTFLAARYFPVMLSIPGGTDTIGDIEVRGPFGYKVDEKHAVTLSPFKMAKTETTWWQYNLFCEAISKKKPDKPSWGSQGDNPVINVFWYDAVAYANWLSDREGRNIALEKTGSSDADYNINLKSNGYRLPTEAEWEYAARARTPFKYAGSSSIDSVAWYNGNSGSRTHPVAEKKANAFGLYDVSGNAGEWCWDWLADHDKNATPSPTGAEKGNFHVHRGGSWLHNAGLCRVSFRTGSTPTTRFNTLGFRLFLQ
jgi:formylglycine-generating enzyme required for sulfatase activity